MSEQMQTMMSEQTQEQVQTWIFGYGSLICADSRSRSGHTGDCLPVIVSGVARSWSAKIDLEKLGAVKNPQVRGVTAGT